MQSVAPNGDAWDEDARQRDERDPLRSFRDRFYLPAGGRIYLDGNSLGLLSRDAEQSVLQLLADWRDLAIEGWTAAASEAWFTLPEELGRQTGELLGAEPGSVIVTGSTTLNLHQILATFYDPARPDRARIVCDALNFPSDRYALESHLRQRGKDPATHLREIPSRDGFTLNSADILAALAEPGVQMAVLPTVLYVSGQLLEVEAITRHAHGHGVRIAWDASHSVGAVPHRLDAWDVDYAFWCTYKYLNAGPGSVGGLYVNRRHWGESPGLAGWFGSRKDRQFDLSPHFHPAEDSGALQIGTPHLLSLAPLIGSLAIHQEAGSGALRAKSLALTAYLRELFASLLPEEGGFSVVTPVEDDRRGGHVALRHPEGAQIAMALRAAGVVPDFRPPDVLRLAPAPLYISFQDCLTAVRRLRGLYESQAYRTSALQRGLVT
jgi:kynureninase